MKKTEKTIVSKIKTKLHFSSLLWHTMSISKQLILPMYNTSVHKNKIIAALNMVKQLVL